MVRQAFSAPLVLLAAGCLATYEAAPEARLLDTETGFLTDTKAPIRLLFDPPVDPSTLKLKVVEYKTDAEGNLPDEDADPTTFFYKRNAEYPEELDKPPPVNFFFEVDNGVALDPGAVTGDGRVVSLQLATPPPVGPRLAILIEPGTRGTNGVEIKTRRRVPFGYEFRCSGNKTSSLPSGAYFFLIDLEAPISGVQIQLFGRLEVDPTTGAFKGRMTNADRRSDLPGCPPCIHGEVCRTQGVVHPVCVKPSERPQSTSEYADFYANSTPPVGFSFLVEGCAEDDGDAVSFAIKPVDVVVQQPAVTVTATTLSASFKKEQGVYKGVGSLASPLVLIGSAPSGGGKGTLRAEQIPEEKLMTPVPGP